MTPPPITITICVGQTCSRMSSKLILGVASGLALKHPGRIDVQTFPCFARCQQDEPGLCPSVCINGTWLHNADETMVKRKLRALLDAPPLPGPTNGLPLWGNGVSPTPPTGG